MSTDRKFLLKRALLATLLDADGYPLREEALREHAQIKVDYLRLTTAEIDAAVREIDTARLATSLPTERGRKFQITDAGKLWLAENQ